jgi:hypothetical protein
MEPAMTVQRMNIKPEEFLQYYQNRPKFPAAELVKYSGMHVAFSLDGLRIVASGKTIEELEENVVATGFDPARVVQSYIDP